MGDVVAIDTDAAAEVASTVRQIGERAGEVASEIEAALRLAELPSTSAIVVSEVRDECRALARYVEAVTSEAQMRDQLGAGAEGAGWLTAMRSDWRRTRDELWIGLNDSVGARAIDQGGFSLAHSLMSIDRATWMRTAIPPGCRSFGPHAYYTGGGAVRGPDGREYPIVIPHVERGDEHYTIDADLPPDVPSAASLDGNDAGWTVVGYRTGVEQVHADIGAPWQVLIALAHATGLPAGSAIDDGQLAGIELRLGGRAVFTGAITSGAAAAGGSVATAGQAIEPHTGPVVDGRVPGRTPGSPKRNVALPNPPAPPGVVARANLRGNAASLAIGGLQGVQVAMAVNDSNDRAYEVIFEEHADGRLRSRVQSFALEPRGDGVLLAAWHLFVDVDGQLHQSPAKYQSGASDETAEDDSGADDRGVVAENSLDPDYAPKVPNAAIDPG